MFHRAGFHIAFGAHVNACRFVIELEIAGGFHHTVQGVTAFFDVHSTHLKGNDDVPLFDECVVQIAAVHAGIGGGADCAGRGIQTVDFGDHIAVGCGG